MTFVLLRAITTDEQEHRAATVSGGDPREQVERLSAQVAALRAELGLDGAKVPQSAP